MSKASNKGEGQDDFAFQISKDEYLELLFDDLELPNLKKNRRKFEATSIISLQRLI